MESQVTELKKAIESEMASRILFTQKLHDLINELLDRMEIQVAQTESRTKSVDSILEKSSREGKMYVDPLMEITDISGIRIITYYQEDIEKVDEIIKAEFTVDNVNSIDKRQILADDRFGYQSVHYVIALSSKRCNLTEWALFRNFTAEIQVRTVLQHAWAAIDHKLRYKSEEEVPRNLRRKLFRISALLEMADDEFTTLRKLTIEQRQKYEREIGNGDLKFDLNRESLQIYIRSSNRIHELKAFAKEIGYQVQAHDRKILGDLLLHNAQKAGIKTIEELDIIVRNELEGETQRLKQIMYICKAQKSSSSLAVETIIRMLVILSMDYQKAKQLVLITPFKKRFNEIVLEFIEHYINSAS